MGILYLIPFLALRGTKAIDFTFSSQTIINGTLGLAKRLSLFKNAHVVLRESNSIFELLSGYKLKIYAVFYTLGYKGSSLVICQTEYMKNQLLEALPKLSKKLNLQAISNPFSFDDVKDKTGVIPQEFKTKSFIVAAGRLAPAKGFDILLDVFHDVSLVKPHLHLIILGEGPDREILEKKVKELGLEQSVFLPGYVNNVYSFFREAKACILSSRIEGFPNVLMQMMSQNNTVVATLSAGGIDEIPGIFTCPPKNGEKLKEAIISALESSNDMNRTLFNTYLETRTWNSFYDKIMNNIEL